MLIHDVLPAPDFSEVHSVHVRSNVERSLLAARQVTAAEIRWLRPLWAARVLPVLLGGGRSFRFRAERPVWEAALDAGFVPVGESPVALALTHIGQHWRPAGGERPDFGDLEGFRRFDRPGFCRVALEVRAAPHEDGVLLATETRVAATDDESRARFRRYWMMIRPFSGMIRNGWLRAARRRAEA